VGDVTTPVHQHPHHAPDVAADLRELAGELVGDEAIGRQAALVEALDGADLTGLQAVGVAENLNKQLLIG
jgi:hypothetical protein